MSRPARQPPTRKSIERLALRDPIVMHALQLHSLGRATYEEALHVALIAVCDQNAVLMARLSIREQTRLESLRLGIPVCASEAAPAD